MCAPLPNAIFFCALYFVAATMRTGGLLAYVHVQKEREKPMSLNRKPYENTEPNQEDRDTELAYI